MARWQELVEAEADLTRRARALFDAHRHKVLATLRRDGSPRVSGIEATFQDGELWIGSMVGSRKVADLARDARMALHTMSGDPAEDGWLGDAKLSGRAVRVDDPLRLARLAHHDDSDPVEAPGESTAGAAESTGGAADGVLYRIDIDEIVLTTVGEPPDHLVIELLRAGQPMRRERRY